MPNAEEIDRDGFLVGNSHVDLEQELLYLKDIFEKARRVVND